MALITAHLHAQPFQRWQCSVKYNLPAWNLSPCQYLSGENSALNKATEQARPLKTMTENMQK